MKVLIWVSTFFFLVVIQVIVKNMGIILGGIPSAILFASAWYAASCLSKTYDKRKEECNEKESSLDSANGKSSSFDEPHTAFISDEGDNDGTFRTGITNPRKLILPIACCMIMLLLAIVIGMLISKSSTPAPRESIPSTTAPISAIATETESISDSTEIPSPPDTLSSDCDHAFAERYPDEDLKSIHKNDGSPLSFDIFKQIYENIYAKAFNSGFNAGWQDYYADTIDRPATYSESDIYLYEIREIAYADGYHHALSLLGQ